MKTITINEEKMLAFNHSELRTIHTALVDRRNKFYDEYKFMPPMVERLLNKIEKELEN